MLTPVRVGLITAAALVFPLSAVAQPPTSQGTPEQQEDPQEIQDRLADRAHRIAAEGETASEKARRAIAAAGRLPRGTGAAADPVSQVLPTAHPGGRDPRSATGGAGNPPRRSEFRRGLPQARHARRHGTHSHAGSNPRVPRRRPSRQTDATRGRTGGYGRVRGAVGVVLRGSLPPRPPGRRGPQPVPELDQGVAHHRPALRRGGTRPPHRSGQGARERSFAGVAGALAPGQEPDRHGSGRLLHPQPAGRDRPVQRRRFPDLPWHQHLLLLLPRRCGTPRANERVALEANPRGVLSALGVHGQCPADHDLGRSVEERGGGSARGRSCHGVRHWKRRAVPHPLRGTLPPSRGARLRARLPADRGDAPPGGKPSGRAGPDAHRTPAVRARHREPGLGQADDGRLRGAVQRLRSRPDGTAGRRRGRCSCPHVP